jgi:hypothetical protein
VKEVVNRRPRGRVKRRKKAKGNEGEGRAGMGWERMEI